MPCNALGKVDRSKLSNMAPAAETAGALRIATTAPRPEAANRQDLFFQCLLGSSAALDELCHPRLRGNFSHHETSLFKIGASCTPAHIAQMASASSTTHVPIAPMSCIVNRGRSMPKA